MERKFPLPTGELNVPTSMPNKGTGTGFNGDSYGADTGMDSTNRMVGISGSTKSDKWDEDFANEAGEGTPAEEAEDAKDEGM